ncbi:hypothetical protein [Nonomuraea sp. NPDC049141]|uniref:hypothetical protein n=1 Tax=Nonomuraea sp. NPDC049141 TaxID=3155500 RepID=UPI0033E45C0E
MATTATSTGRPRHHPCSNAHRRALATDGLRLYLGVVPAEPPRGLDRSEDEQADDERADADPGEERRSRVITAEGELQASEKLAQAAETMTEHPAALQSRLLQTVVEVAAEKNSTLVLPFPVELLRFLERATPPEAAPATATNGTSTPPFIATRPEELSLPVDRPLQDSQHLDPVASNGVLADR